MTPAITLGMLLVKLVGAISGSTVAMNALKMVRPTEMSAVKSIFTGIGEVLISGAVGGVTGDYAGKLAESAFGWNTTPKKDEETPKA